MRRRNWLLPAILLVLCFAWGNSILSGELSKSMSGGIREMVIQMLPFLAQMPERVLRKFAHFAEFAVLGFLLAWYTVRRGKRGVARFFTPFSLSVLAALIDETIQIYRPGRLSSVTDVWIDTFGACTGILLLLLGHTVFTRITKKGNSE